MSSLSQLSDSVPHFLLGGDSNTTTSSHLDLLVPADFCAVASGSGCVSLLGFSLGTIAVVVVVVGGGGGDDAGGLDSGGGVVVDGRGGGGVVAVIVGGGGVVVVIVIGGRTRRDKGNTRSNTHGGSTFLLSRSFLNSRNNFFFNAR